LTNLWLKLILASSLASEVYTPGPCAGVSFSISVPATTYSISQDGYIPLRMVLVNGRDHPIRAVAPPPPLVGFKDLRFTDVKLDNPAGEVVFRRLEGWIPWPVDDRTRALEEYIILLPEAALTSDGTFNLRDRGLTPGQYSLSLIYQAPSSSYRRSRGFPESPEPLLGDCRARSSAVHITLVP
jgi:hypothetical protein